MEFVIKRISSDELKHYGVKGQKWGVRNYQNADGSLTPEGQARLARSQRYVQSKQKTVGQRVRRTLGAGLIGGLVPGLAGAAGLTGTVLGSLAAGGTSLAGLTAGGVAGLAAAGAISAAPLMAIGGLGGLAIAGIKHGVQATKVRRGQDFMDKFSSKSRG